MKRKHICIAVILSGLTLWPALASSQEKGDQLTGFKRILPRGKIRPILRPKYVPADEAAISKNSYVLGVVIAGQPLAYSLNLLNRHEVVNDKIGDLAFAAVW